MKSVGNIVTLVIVVLTVGCSDKPDDARLKWFFETGNVVPTCPAVAKDGTIYIGSHDCFLYSIDREGVMKWRFKTGDFVHGSPTLDS
ncbi:MAG: PQQ-binding-like beta-propeller repeat protein, partial [Planctomycetota bacterium]